MSEDEDLTGRDAGEPTEDNSLPRLLALSDGIFAIAMTLLALDLKVPDLGDHVTDASLRHALASTADSYWSYLLTFYMVAGYWVRHRRLMRSTVASHDVLTRDTLLLLAVVAAMPFPAALLGTHASLATPIALYAAFNVVATSILMLTSWDIRRLHLAPHATDDGYYAHRWQSWWGVVVFLLLIPMAYVFAHDALYFLFLLAVPDRLAWWRRLLRRQTRA